MKTNLAVLALGFALVASSAFAQGNSDACHNEYSACTERCLTRPPSIVESCMKTCESMTNTCYGNMFGPQSAAGQPAGDAQASEARDEAKPETAPTPKAARKTKR